MGGAGDSGVIGPDRHFDPVEDMIVDLPVSDQVPCGPVRAEVDGGQVMGRAHDNINPGDQAVFIC